MPLSREIEVLNLKEERPFSVHLSYFLLSPIQLCSTFLLFLSLKGSAEISIGGEKFVLHERQFVLVNPLDFYQIKQDDVRSLLLRFSLSADFFHNSESYSINQKRLLAQENQNPAVFKAAIEGILKILYLSNKYSFHLKYEIDSLCADLVSFLSNNGYYVPRPKGPIKKEEERRIEQVVDLVMEHLQDDFPLSEAAEAASLNYYYLSHFFSDFSGFSFKEFQISQKLCLSLPLLAVPEERIIDIAFDCGFNSSITYCQSFKQAFGLTPQDYRKTSIETQANSEQLALANKAQEDVFAELEASFGSMSIDMIKESLAIDPSSSGERLDPYYLKMISISRASEGLYANNQAALLSMVKELPFSYIKLKGIFNDEMMILNTIGGKDVYNFAYLDRLIDFVLSIGLRPYCEIGFMPKELASKDLTLYYWRANVSLPNSFPRWAKLVEATLAHLKNRYGEDEIAKWYFDVWNKPNFTGVFFDGNVSDYARLFAETYKAAKKGCPSCRVGGPNISTSGDYLSFSKEFLSKCSEENVAPDFYSFQIYGDLTKTFQAVRSPNNFLTIERREMNDQDYLDTCLNSLLQTLGREKELVVSEWNISARTNFYIRDTAFMGPYIIDTVLRSERKAKMLCVWLLSDAIEENKAPLESFHGGLGLINIQGLKKPSYHAFRFLSRLGEDVLEKGHGYLVTKKGNDFILLLYNLAYFDKLGINSDFRSLTPSNAYSFFKKRGEKEYHIVFRGPKGIYLFHKEAVSRNHGSVFDEYVKSGFSEPLSKENIAYLAEKSRPAIEENVITLSPGQELAVRVDENEMVLLEIKALKISPN